MKLVWHVSLAIMMAPTPEQRGSGDEHYNILTAAGEVLLVQMADKQVRGSRRAAKAWIAARLA